MRKLSFVIILEPIWATLTTDRCWQLIKRMRVLILLPVLVFISLAPEQASADRLYMIKDSKGVITFTSRRPRGVKYETLKSDHPRYSKNSSKGKRRGWSFRARKSKYDQLIKKKAEEHRINPALVKAVVHVESAFNASAVSPKGAVGLMQLMPATAKRFGVKNRVDPEDNLSGGIKYLVWLSKRYKGNLKYMLAAYNAGEGAVDRAGGVPPYKETRNYVKRVTEAFKKYHKQEGV